MSFTDTIGLGTEVHAEGDTSGEAWVRVTRKCISGQTYWYVYGGAAINSEPEGWYSQPEAIAAARRMVKRTG